MKRLGPTLGVLLLAACAAPSAPAPGCPPDEAAAADPGALNPWVLEVLHEYPLDGSFAYHWPREGSWEGTTQDLVWQGHKLTSGDPQRRSYCCGLTFEVYVRALERAADGQDVPGVDGELLHELRLRFFGDSAEGERRRLVQFGLESLGLGRRIERLEEARAGDFVQLWRHSGSGHQAVFINWVWRGQEIVGLTYWSSQSATHGVGYRTEAIDPDGVKRDEIYIVRASWPPT